MASSLGRGVMLKRFRDHRQTRKRSILVARLLRSLPRSGVRRRLGRLAERVHALPTQLQLSQRHRRRLKS